MRGHGTALMLVAIVSLGIFATAVQNDFVWDDALIILTNEGLRQFSPPWRFFTPSYWEEILANYRGMPGRAYRPIPELLFAIDWALWEKKPAGYHAASVLTHTLTCLLVYALAFRVTQDKRAALFGALLFAAHPIHVEPVVWIKARSDVLALLFTLAAILLYARYLDAPSGSTALLLYPGAVLAAGLAVMCKLSVIILPGLLAVYVLCCTPRRTWRRGLFGILPFTGVVLTFLAADAPITHKPAAYYPQAHHFLFTSVAVLGVYFRLLVLPIGLCAHHPMRIVTSVVDPLVLRALPWHLLGLLLCVVAAVRRSRVARFAVLWMVVAFAPPAAVWGVGRLVGEIRAYTPSVGFCLLGGFALSRIANLRAPSISRRSLEWLAVGLCALVVGAYARVTISSSMDWSHPLTLWTAVLKQNPRSWHAHKSLGIIYARRRQYDKAIPYLQAAVTTRQMDRHIRYWLATAYTNSQRLEEAIQQFEYLVQDDPQDARTRAELASLYGRTGAPEKAMAEFERALRDAPDSAMVHRQLGIFDTAAGRHADALRELWTALELKPNSPATYHALGVLHEQMGDARAAVGFYEKCIALGGAHADTARERLEGLRGRAPDDGGGD